MNTVFPTLSRGDVVSIVAPAGPVEGAALKRGQEVLQGWGLVPKLGTHTGEATGYLAGDDRQRAADLAAAFNDGASRAVWYARGGYGTTRLLPLLDLESMSGTGKLLLGFSDATALGLALSKHAPHPFLHGPTVTLLGAAVPDYDRESLEAGLFGRHPDGRQSFYGLEVVKPGKGRGVLLGGCLSLITALLGTPYMPALDGKVLFLEEVNEEPYRLDRMLTQLASAGRLAELAGLLIGQLTGCVPAQGRPASPTAREVVASFADAVGGPVLAGLPVGHGPMRTTIPLGVMVEVDGEQGTVVLHRS